MTRALRPNGIQWPDVDGKAANKLELLASVNGLDHVKAHDALSDVEALIALTKLIKERQHQLFDYLYRMRGKNEVKKLVNLDDKQPFVYTSGRYDADHHKTTVAFPLTSGRNGNVVVYDLRINPSPFLGKSKEELAVVLFAPRDVRSSDGFVPLPVKELQYNRAPAVAPLGVLEQGDGWGRMGLTIKDVEAHKRLLLGAPHFAENIRSVIESRPEFPPAYDPEAQLYDGFVGDRDRLRIETVRNATERELADFHPDFSDERLAPLLLHYKARNFPKALSEDEARAWELWRGERINREMSGFVQSLQKISKDRTDEESQFILQELQLWAESIVPTDLSEPQI